MRRHPRRLKKRFRRHDGAYWTRLCALWLIRCALMVTVYGLGGIMRGTFPKTDTVLTDLSGAATPLTDYAGSVTDYAESVTDNPGPGTNYPAESDEIPTDYPLSDTSTPSDEPAPVEPLTEHSDPGTEPLNPPAEPLAPSSDPAPETPWNLRLINEEHLLPDGYQPPELTSLNNGHAVDSRVYPALKRMMDDAWAAGYQPMICSSFRSMEKQTTLFNRRVRTYQRQGYSAAQARILAAHWVARPGSSEHEAGLALDIVDQSDQVLEREQENTPAQQWLMAHCVEYGFILRYPEDKTDITGIGYEPWHYRYVGEDAAREITQLGLCLEEYVERFFTVD